MKLGKALKVEIVENSRDIQKGLMFRKELKNDSGMLFIFSENKKLAFWGRNTYIPLDIAFIDNKNVIKKISHIFPLSEKPISSEYDCCLAIEANYGFFSDNKIYEGDQVHHLRLTNKIGVALFKKKE